MFHFCYKFVTCHACLPAGRCHPLIFSYFCPMKPKITGSFFLFCLLMMAMTLTAQTGEEIKAIKDRFESGNTFMKRGDYPNAIKEYTTAIQLHPRYADAFYNRAAAWDRLGNYAEAVSDYSVVLMINPKYAEAYNNRGIAYANLKRYLDAVADFSVAVSLNIRFAEAYNNRGYYNCMMGKFEKAIPDFDRAIRLNPSYGYAYNNRGFAWFSLKKFTQAMADYNMAIEKNPKNGLAFLYRGNCHEVMGAHDKACLDWMKSAALGNKQAEELVKRNCR